MPMLKSILLPNKRNALIWLSALIFVVFVIADIAEPFTIVMAYFMETLLIGVIQVIKIIIAGSTGNFEVKEGKSIAGIVLFFMAHYTFFVFVQSVFVFVVFANLDPNIKEPFDVIDNYSYALHYPGIGWTLLTMFLALIWQTYVTFIRNGKYLINSPMELMFQPYLRIFVQQLAVIFSFMFALLLNSGLILASVLIAIKLFIDLVGVHIGVNAAQREKLAEKITRSNPEKKEEVAKQLGIFFE